MKRNKRGVIESLENRRLLSVSAATLAGPTTPGTMRTYETLTNGAVTATSTQTFKGPATYNGHSAIEVDGTDTSSPGAIVKSYFAFDASGNAVSYGSTGVIPQGAFTTIETPAAIEFPATINPGQTLTFNWSTTETFPGGSFLSQTQHTIELTSATLQSVTVPAGTFQAYLINLTDTITEFGLPGTPSTSQEWVVPNKGVVKTVNATTTTELIPNAIVVGPPAKLGFSQQPLSAAAGAAMSPALKVDVLDATGNLVANNTSTVTLSIFSGPTGGTLTGTLSAAAVGGIATFSNVSASAVGSYVIQATDGSLTLAKTTPIVVSTTTGAAKLAFINSPAAGAAAAPLSLAVGVQTSSGQNVPTDSSKVTLSIASGPAGAVLGGTIAVNALAGVARFTGVTLSKPGLYTLKATDGGLTAAVSTPFTITAAVVASKLVYLGNQASGTAGKPLVTPVPLAVETSTGTIVTSDASKVTLSVTSGPAGGALTGTTAINVVAGVASFTNLVFSQPGTYKLSATDGALTAATVTVVVTAPITASKLAYLASPAAGIAGATVSTATVAIESAAGVIISTDTSKVSLAIASGPVGGTLLGTIAATAVSGFATFSNLKFTVAGTYTLKATDGSLTSAITNPIVIAAAAASKLVIAAQPLTGTAGKALAAITVQVEDAFGNVVNNGSTVKLAATTFPVGGAISGTLSVVAVKGIATFTNISANVVGAYALTATDGSLTAAISKPIVISAAAASKLVVVTQPTTGTAGKNLTAMIVKVEDAFGNVVTNNGSIVKLAAATVPTGGAVAGTLSVTAVAGVATFPAVSMKVAGAYTLKATDGTLVSALTKPITIAAAAASKLVISQQPTAGKALAALVPALVVKIEDAFGNVVTTAASTVTLTLATGTAGQLAGTTAVIASKGVATFSNLSFKKAGTYTLKAAEGLLTAAVSKAIVIT